MHCIGAALPTQLLQYCYAVIGAETKTQLLQLTAMHMQWSIINVPLITYKYNNLHYQQASLPSPLSFLCHVNMKEYQSMFLFTFNCLQINSLPNNITYSFLYK